MQRRGQPTYLLNLNLQIWLQYQYFDHASNAKVIQAFKLVDRINLGEILGLVDKLHSFNSKSDNNSNTETTYKPAFINKAIEYNLGDVKEFCKICIKSKYTRIINSKKMTITKRRLQKIYANLWGLYKYTSILGKSYIALLLNKFMYKLQVLILRSKDKFFNIFKL